MIRVCFRPRPRMLLTTRVLRGPPQSVQEGTGSVRFVSVPDFSSKINRFGSVRKIEFTGSTRFGLRFSDAIVAWSGSVRFVSASDSGRFQN